MKTTLPESRRIFGAPADPLDAGAYGARGARFKPEILRKFLAGLVIALIFAAISPTIQAAGQGPVKLLMLGDSLTAGYGIGPGKALPEQLQAALREKGHDVAVTNAGVSGDTSAGGLARLPWLLGEPFDAAIVALGANDGLRGLDPAGTRDNLEKILAILRDGNIPVLLAGMVAPPNLGADYAATFNPIYSDLAARDGVSLYPFILEGVATSPDLNQADGIHPNAEGVAEIVRRMLPSVESLVAKAR